MKTVLVLLIIFFKLFCFGQDTARITFRFSSNSSKLSKTQLKSIDSLILTMEEYTKESFFYIQGHTDSIGNRPYNVRLSEKRCWSVKNILMQNGVEEQRINFEKYASDAPLASNETEVGRADNRRTTLSIITKIPAPAWDIEPQRFLINPNKETTLKTKNDCKIIVPKDAFVLPDALPAEGKINLEVIEYDNPASFIASGIPMSYNASGQWFVYHSEEMLNIKAFYDAMPLELRPEAKITLNCKTVDSLYVTDFYKFNLEEKKWFLDEEKAQPFEAPAEKKPKVADENAQQNPQENKTISLKSVDLEKKPLDKLPEENVNQEKSNEEVSPEERSHEGLITDQIEKKIKKIPELRLDSGSFKPTRFDSGHASKSVPILLDKAVDERTISCGYSCCDLEFVTMLGKKITEKPIDLRAIDLPHNYPFVKKGEDMDRWVELFDSEEIRQLKNYYAIKLKTKKLFLRKKALVSIRFDSKRNPELKALKKIKWTYRFKDNTEEYTSFNKRKFHDLRITYDAQSKTALVNLEGKDSICTILLKAKDPENKMDAKMQAYQKILTPRVMWMYECLWHLNERFFAKADRGLAFIDWVAYFNTHLGELHQRYDSLNKISRKIMEELKCCPKYKYRDSLICYDCEPKQILKRSGPNRILIIGLGTYNFDNEIELKNLMTINSPVFKTRFGRIINVKERFLILSGVNGMMHLKATEPLILAANYENTLFIVDKANRRYKLVMKAKEDLKKRGSVFILEDVSRKTKDLKGFEKELLGK